MGMESLGATGWVTETSDSGTQCKEADDMGQVLVIQEPKPLLEAGCLWCFTTVGES